MNATQEKPKRKTWIWIVVILAVLLVCCLIAAVAGGYFYLESTGKTVEDALSGGLLEPQGDSLSTQVTLAPTVEDMPEPAAPTDEPSVTAAGNQVVVISADGVWGVVEDTGRSSPIEQCMPAGCALAPRRGCVAGWAGFCLYHRLMAGRQ